MIKHKCFKCGKNFRIKHTIETDKPTCDACWRVLLKIKTAGDYRKFLSTNQRKNMKTKVTFTVSLEQLELALEKFARITNLTYPKVEDRNRQFIEKLLEAMKELPETQKQIMNLKIALEDLEHEMGIKLPKNALIRIVKIWALEMVGKDIDIQRLVNPDGTGAGNHYPDMVDLPMRSIALKAEGANEALNTIRKRIEESD